MMRAAIVTAATGHGHLAAARALAEAMRARGGVPELFDFGTAHPLLGALAGTYNAFLRRPPRWMTAFFWAVNAVRPDRMAYGLAGRAFLDHLHRARTTVVLSVHPMANYGIAETLAREGIHIPFAVILTDLAPPFWRGWAESRAAAVTAPTPAAAERLAAWGVARPRILQAPIPVRPLFRAHRSPQQRHTVLQELGLEDGRTTVTFNAGLAARSSALRAYRALAAGAVAPSRVQAIFLAGRDAGLLQRARAVSAPFPAAVLPWRDDPETILAATDVLFTKPGGLTVSEAFAAGVPLLLDTCGGVMPQERGNAAWAAASGAAWPVDTPEELPALLEQVAGRSLASLHERARAAVAGDATTVLDVLENALAVGAPAVALRQGADLEAVGAMGRKG